MKRIEVTLQLFASTKHQNSITIAALCLCVMFVAEIFEEGDELNKWDKAAENNNNNNNFKINFYISEAL